LPYFRHPDTGKNISITSTIVLSLKCELYIPNSRIKSIYIDVAVHE
jgi:hypothetical protein